MAIDTQQIELKLVRTDGQEVNLLPLQGLWTSNSI